MALEIVVDGPGKLISHEPSVNDYFVTFFGGVTQYRDTTTTEVREWYALTEEAALAGAAVDQPEEGTYTFIVSEDNRVVQSYTLTRTHVVTTTEEV